MDKTVVIAIRTMKAFWLVFLILPLLVPQTGNGQSHLNREACRAIGLSRVNQLS